MNFMVLDKEALPKDQEHEAHINANMLSTIEQGSIPVLTTVWKQKPLRKSNTLRNALTASSLLQQLSLSKLFSITTPRTLLAHALDDDFEAFWWLGGILLVDNGMLEVG